MTHYLGIDKISALTVVTPSINAEVTEGLLEVSQGSIIILKRILKDVDIELINRQVFNCDLDFKHDLPADAVFYFAEKADKRVERDIGMLLTTKRFHVLKLFLADPVDDDWFAKNVIQPWDLPMTENDVDDLRTVDIINELHPLERAGNFFEMLGAKLLVRKSHCWEPD